MACHGPRIHVDYYYYLLGIHFLLLPRPPHPLATSSIGAVGDEVTVTVSHPHTPTVDVTYLSYEHFGPLF